MAFNIDINSDEEEMDVRADDVFEFKLPRNDHKNINILNDNILFNKANISQDVLSMSSRSSVSDTSSVLSDEIPKMKKTYNISSSASSSNTSSTSDAKSSKSSVVIRKEKSNRHNNELDEKREILYKFDRMKSKNKNIPYNFTMASDLMEMKAAYDRIKHEQEIDSSIRFQRKMLMSFVNTVEFLNNTYDPFAVELGGWSESVYDSIDDYDDIFEDLHEKYKNTGSGMAPEVRLLFTLGSSAFVFNLTKSMFSQTKIPNVEKILKSDPELMKRFQQASSQHYMNENFGMPPQPSSPPKKEQPKTGDIFSQMSGMFGPLFNNSNESALDVDSIINNVHNNIRIIPDNNDNNDIEETLTVTDDDISQIIDNFTDDSIKERKIKRKPGGKKKVLDL